MYDITEDKIMQLDGLLEKSSSIVLISHANADGDAVGSTSALLSYLKEKRNKKDVHAILPDAFGKFLDFVPGERTLLSENPAAAAGCIGRADLIVALDISNLGRANGLGDLVRDRRTTKVLIDHHPAPAADEFDLVFSRQNVSSACELLYDILMRLPDIASDAAGLPADCRTALMTGMTTDTNNFGNSVYPGTLQMASALLATGVDRDDILLHLFHEYRENRVRATGWLTYNNLKIREDGFAYIIIDKATKERFSLEEGETEGLVNIALTLKKVRISALLKEDDGYFRVSLRSKKGISINAFAGEFFHGGGHPQASGGRICFPGDIDSPGDVERYLNDAADKFLEKL